MSQARRGAIDMKEVVKLLKNSKATKQDNAIAMLADMEWTVDLQNEFRTSEGLIPLCELLVKNKHEQNLAIYILSIIGFLCHPPNELNQTLIAQNEGLAVVSELLFTSQNATVVEKACFAFTALVLNNDQTKNHARKIGAVKEFARLLTPKTNVNLLQPLIYGYGSLCQNNMQNKEVARESGGLKFLCGFVQVSRDWNVIMESCFAIGKCIQKNPASKALIKSFHTQKTFIELCKHENKEVVKAALFAIGQFCANDLDSQNALLQTGGLKSLVIFLRSKSRDTQRASLYVLNNLCNSNSEVKGEIRDVGGIKLLLNQLRDAPPDDQDVLWRSCRVLGHLVYQEPINEWMVEESGGLQLILNTTKGDNAAPQLLSDSCACLGNAAWGNKHAQDYLIKIGAVEKMISLLDKGHRDVSRSCLYAIGCICLGNEAACDRVVESKIIPKLIKDLTSNQNDVRWRAVRCIAIIAFGSKNARSKMKAENLDVHVQKCLQAKAEDVVAWCAFALEALAA